MHLGYFLNEAGMECTDIPAADALFPEVGLGELHDIRDCAAYKAYTQLFGGTLDLREDGYKELGKE